MPFSKDKIYKGTQNEQNFSRFIETILIIVIMVLIRFDDSFLRQYGIIL